MWLPPGVDPDSETLESEFQRLCKDEVLEDVFAVFEAMDAYHPKEPCWYLPMIGVDPAYQGQGIGEALTLHRLRVARKQGYKNLVTRIKKDNIASLFIAQRFGYKRVGDMTHKRYLLWEKFDYKPRQGDRCVKKTCCWRLTMEPKV